MTKILCVHFTTKINNLKSKTIKYDITNDVIGFSICFYKSCPSVID